ncbi:MAG: response regulator [Verrucomicrobia bacterium]|nr:MAG: response regulator [Verrucomicrobiota bacterium]
MAFKLNALVVDDDTHVRSFLAVLMRKVVAGRILEASNGQEAIDIYREQRPEVVLLDVNMPITDGLEALRKIREIDPEAVVIMLTSLAMRRVVEDALELGAANFIRKDTPRPQMIEIIEETLLDTFGETARKPSTGTTPADVPQS